MPPKSIFRQPGAKHFQLVHRSQRDPLYHDPDAGKHVLKPFERENAKKGKSRADLESILPSSDLANDKIKHVGEATLYGVYYDDTEYDYMQHLRSVGVNEDGVESVLIEAPSSSKTQAKKTKGIELRDLPAEAFPSASELPRTYESQQAVPESIAGFQPDMDPHLRQVLEALEDNAFVDDELEDDFFGKLVADGERGSDEEVGFEFQEDILDHSSQSSKVEDGSEDGWEERFAEFKKAQNAAEQRGESDDEYGSEGGDTIEGLPTMSVIGGKKRRKGTSDASGYSMSSSSMYRNEALQTLDERFDQMILKQYNEDSEDASPSSEESDSDDAPDLITSREDFESMMDEFLNDYEQLGRKLKPKLSGETGPEKLDTIRRAMGQDERVRIGEEDDDDDDSDDIYAVLEDGDKKDRWDCETILTTYTNLENHPRLIRARDSKPVPKILLDPKTGLPAVVDSSQESKKTAKPIRTRAIVKPSSEESNHSDSDTDSSRRPQTIIRPRNESKEEKKARKAAVKTERQGRRMEKKATKEQFGAEKNTQIRTMGNREQRVKKL